MFFLILVCVDALGESEEGFEQKEARKTGQTKSIQPRLSRRGPCTSRVGRFSAPLDFQTPRQTITTRIFAPTRTTQYNSIRKTSDDGQAQARLSAQLSEARRDSVAQSGQKKRN